MKILSFAFDNNKIYMQKNNKQKESFPFLFLKNIKIKGNSNIINLKCSQKQLRGVSIIIKGSNNYIEIEGPIKFKNTEIEINGNENVFKIKRPSRVVKNCYFCLEGLAEVNIDEACGLNMGLYAIINNNFKNVHKLIIWKGVFIGKDVIIRTSDGHSIIDPITKLPINEPQDVIIGNNVWIGARSMILKGAKIPNGSIVGAQSLVNKPFEQEHILLVGSPAKIARTNVFWNVKPYGTMCKDLEIEGKL